MIVVCRIKFQSVASPPKGDGKLAGMMRVPLRALPAFSILGALAQACKQSSRRFTRNKENCHGMDSRNNRRRTV